MVTYHICKADPLPETPEEATIIINRALPKDLGVDAIDKFYDDQAAEIVGALARSLPQGTRVRVAKKLLEYEISGFGFFRGR